MPERPLQLMRVGVEGADCARGSGRCCTRFFCPPPATSPFVMPYDVACAEMVVVGTGRTMQFVDPVMIATLQRRGIAVETMATVSATSTEHWNWAQ